MGWLIAAAYTIVVAAVGTFVLCWAAALLAVFNRPDPPAVPPVVHDISPSPSLLYGAGAVVLTCRCGWHCTLPLGDIAGDAVRRHYGMIP